MGSALLQLQQAVLSALSNDAQLSSLVGQNKVFDHVPERAKFPYIVLGDQHGKDWSTSSEEGTQIDFLIHLWSEARKPSQLSLMEHEVRRIVQETDFELPDHHVVLCRFIWADFSRHQNLRHRQGVLKFRGMTEPK